MKQQLATLRISGALQKSTDVMKSMNSLINIPEMSKTMRAMSKEMEKSGLIEEMMNDAIDDVTDFDGMQDQVDNEVENILYELTAGQLGTAPEASNKVPEVIQPTVEEDIDEDDIEARMAALGK